jgi:hypothetical protein
MGPGHPLFDTLIEWAIREARQAFAKGATVVDPNIAKPQRVWLVRSTIEDGRRQWRQDRRKPPAHERLALVVQDHLGLRTTSPLYGPDRIGSRINQPLVTLRWDVPV